MGLINNLDLDSDNDGIPDTQESLTLDTDGDGKLNFVDIDSDNDGITDNVEAQTTLSFKAPKLIDTDNDGLDDQYDPDNGGTAIILSDKDGDLIADYIDMDTDNDGLLDWTEGFDDDNDGTSFIDLWVRADNYEIAASNPLLYVNLNDADSDGVPNWMEDDDNDGVANFLDTSHVFYVDSDSDGLIDLYDENNYGTASNTPDGDSDGEYDFRDPDNQIALPIELVYFNVEQKPGGVKLSWETATEVNNDYFTIERSIDGSTFTPLMTVLGGGNSNKNLRYEALDPSPISGYVYYRLSQTDFDGVSEIFYEQIKVVFFQQETEMKIYPNPTTGEKLYIEMKSPQADQYKVTIRNSELRTVIEKEIMTRDEFVISQINLLKGVNLTRGIYYLQIQSKSDSKMSKFIVQ